MTLKIFKSYTKSTRGTVLVGKKNLWKGRALKSLTIGKHSTGGRNNLGRITSRRRGRPAAALIIGVEKYKRLPEARNARNDALLFHDYATGVLGVPRGQTIRLLDEQADHFGIQDAVRRVGSFVTPETDLYVFFSGHGFASGDGVPYLLPHDGNARFLDQLPSRNDFFESLASLDAKSVTLFLDTCYSGRSRGGDVLAKGMRPLVIASSDKGVPEGFTVISAAANDQFSGDLPGSGHGLFSYYLMRGLQGDADLDRDREITVSELHTFVEQRVTRQAARLGRDQSPELFGDPDRVLVRY